MLSLTRLLAACNLPPSILDAPAFKNFVQQVSSTQEAFPSARAFKRQNGPLSLLVRHIDDIARIKVKNALSASISFDIWSKLTFTSIGVTVHLITNDFRQDRICLGVSEFDVAHSSAAILEKLREEVNPLLPFETIVAMTHDSASNNCSKTFVEATQFAVKMKCTMHKMALACKREAPSHSKHCKPQKDLRSFSENPARREDYSRLIQITSEVYQASLKRVSMEASLFFDRCN
jgi:hypothetical protein